MMINDAVSENSKPFWCEFGVVADKSDVDESSNNVDEYDIIGGNVLNWSMNFDAIGVII